MKLLNPAHAIPITKYNKKRLEKQYLDHETGLGAQV